MNNYDSFQLRHIGPRREEIDQMLQSIGVNSIDELIDQTVPKNIRLQGPLNLPDGITEFDFLNAIEELGKKNKLYKSYIGQGYYNTIVPSVIRRNILENPSWYTAYTPYQAEISQGRLEALLNFQTMVSDFTGLPIANASLLDEGTAAAEAAMMLYNSRSRQQQKDGVNKFFIDENCFKQTIDVVSTKCKALGVDIEIGDAMTAKLNESYFGVLVQYPNASGAIIDMRSWSAGMKDLGIKIVVATDLMAMCLLTPPGEWGADVVVGNSQRFGVPLGYGGPHAGFFATTEDFKRNIPGRIIGVSKDRDGNQALRMALQTREQHIRRDKATSNICTAQALLAIMASMYAVYHGPVRLRAMAWEMAQKADSLAKALRTIGLKVNHDSFFDTINVTHPTLSIDRIAVAALNAEINFYYAEDGSIGISIDETTSWDDVHAIIDLFATLSNEEIPSYNHNTSTSIPKEMMRTSLFLQHPIFSAFQSETDMMRYIKKLENKDISLTRSMITLGSCTMKLNAASELIPITMPEFANIHPFVPTDQALGYTEIIHELHDLLCEITGFDAMSFQPNSGAQGEYTGLMVIKAYHEARGDHQRDIVLIPESAHGTNPASAVIAGLKVMVVKCDDQGNFDLDDLKEKAVANKQNLCGVMVTYPSTHGVFEEGIKTLTQIVHDNGGLVYMDGANMNAQVGLTNPANIGADVCHLNLHKTFAIPHGGGGPGMGPIGVAPHLTPFLPKHPMIETGGENGIGAVSSAPFGSALILIISYAYIKMLGKQGVTDSTKYAILNANYLKSRLEGHYDILYSGANGRIAHEMIVDCRPFKKTAGVEVVDIAKRLIDYGFHAPTVSFPVAGTLMIEPTESESKKEMDLFINALVGIREEIRAIENKQSDVEDNPLKNAPHTAETLVIDDWTHPYSRRTAVFPLDYLTENKFWVPVSRIEDAYGDRNLICTCPPIESYNLDLALDEE